ncbi:unnamed protein product [Discosporangium mesarthrocarpum]
MCFGVVFFTLKPSRFQRCHSRWNQFFSFGEGDLEGHLMVVVPRHLAMASDWKGGVMCLEAVDNPNKVRVMKTAQCNADSPAQKFTIKNVPAPAEESRPPLEEESPIDDGHRVIRGGGRGLQSPQEGKEGGGQDGWGGKKVKEETVGEDSGIAGLGGGGSTNDAPQCMAGEGGGGGCASTG